MYYLKIWNVMLAVTCLKNLFIIMHFIKTIVLLNILVITALRGTFCVGDGSTSVSVFLNMLQHKFAMTWYQTLFSAASVCVWGEALTTLLASGTSLVLGGRPNSERKSYVKHLLRYKSFSIFIKMICQWNK